MSNSLPRAAATAKDGYPRDNFRGVNSDSYPNPQKQQISQPQGYPPKADFPQPSVMVLPPKHDYDLPSSSQASDQDHLKQVKPSNGSHQSSNQQQQQQQPQLAVVRAPLPQNPPKDDHGPSHRGFSHLQQHQQQSSSAPLPAPSTETGLVPSLLNGEQPVLDVSSTANGNRDKTPTVQYSDAKLPSNQLVNEPVVAYPDLSSLPPKTTIKITIPPEEKPESDQKGGCCCSIL
ncbi:hypothetical protein PTKIN_Ptkin16aG0483300 [Pterospermum kingtungense]